MRLFRPTLIVVALLTAALPAPAQHASVRVLADGRPLRHAVVRFTCINGACADSLAPRLSNAEGVAVCPFAARSVVRVTHVGYVTQTDTVNPGQELTVLMEPAIHAQADVVVTAQYTPRSGEQSVYGVRTFTAATIAERAAPTLRDLLKSELNVSMNEDPVLGTGLSLQGLAGQNVKILIDGVPVIGRTNGNIDLNQIHLADAERVELIEGPLSVMYGTDALGGVVNVITNRRVMPGVRGLAELYGESVGVVNTNGEVALSLAETGITLSGGRNFFGGYSDPDTSRVRQWKPREQYQAGVEISRRIAGLRASGSVRYFEEYILNRGEPRAPYRESAFDDTYRTRRLTNMLMLNGSVAPSGYLDAVAGYSTYTRRKNTYYRNLVTLEQQPSASESDHDTAGIGAWMLRASYAADDPAEAFAWQAGLDLGLEWLQGRRINGGYRSLGDYAVFASMQYRPGANLVLQPALRWAYNTRYAAPVVPSVNLRFAPAPDVVIRASYARGFRAPSLRDLYFIFVDINHDIHGNPDLMAETSNAYNCSVDWRLLHGDDRSAVDGATGDMFGIGAAGYYNDVANLITLASIDADRYMYVNVGRRRTLGASLTARCIVGALEASVGVGYAGVRDDASETGARFLYAPEVNAALGWRIPAIDARLSATYKFTGRQPSQLSAHGGGLRSAWSAAYHMLDVTVTREFLDGMLRLTLGGRNLLDVRRIAVTGGDASQAGWLAVAWGRTVAFGTTLRFGGM